VPDGRTIQIQPWDRGLLHAIEKAIQVSDLNLNPVNNGLAVILNIPPLTEERRRDLGKVVNRLAEESKIAVRNLRHDLIGLFKRMEHDGDMTEDEAKGAENDLQEVVDDVNKKIEEMARAKEESVMTV
jgi:ribosome recycling factor